MSEENQGLISTKLSVNRTAVTEIVVAKAEKELRSRRKMLEDELQARTKDCGTMNERHSKVLKDWTKNTAEKIARPYMKLAASKKPRLHATFSEGSEKVPARISIDIQGSDNLRIIFVSDVEKPSFLEQHQQEKDLAAKKIQEVTDQLANLRRAIADLPSLERQVRAKIAEQALSATAEGQDVLKAISGIPALEFLSDG